MEKANLVAMLKQLAAYVQANCQESYEILISSGFDAVRAPSKVGVLPAPANPRMVPTGKSGELLFRIDRVENAANITVEYGTAPEGPFTVLPPATGSRVLISDLTPGTIYFARACANGSAGRVPIATSRWRWRCNARRNSLFELTKERAGAKFRQRAFSVLEPGARANSFGHPERS